MTHYYDIHSLVTVASEVVLPELVPFACPPHTDPATLRVRVERRRAIRPADATDDALVYQEAAGLGFAVRIALGERIEVFSSTLLRHSPHVLYTNVVEPILRWTFVRQGWALIHGACVASGNDAYLISARTDTGKTTTLLTLLRRHPRLAFLADDLCLVRSDGRVLAYPKPMTISQHTLRAINPRALSARERAALRVQSRVHSRSGRRFAHLLARTGLPVATLNTVVQWLIPPPKYAVERLLPHVAQAGTALLCGMFLIERGALETTRQIGHETAMEMLGANCEDAFGFPPYSALESRLRYQDGRDWRQREREIVASAFARQGATLLSSDRFDWWHRIGMSILEASVARTRRAATAPVAFA